MKIFFDTEFTGLHQNTTLISIGMVTENDLVFYGEFTDFDQSQVNDWLKENVIKNLMQYSVNELTIPHYAFIGDKQFITDELLMWLSMFDNIELWSDCLSYDWILLSELIADRTNGYPQYPSNLLYHSPFDILTLFKAKGLDYNIIREKFAFDEYLDEMKEQKHNALWDAKVIKACYEKLTL